MGGALQQEHILHLDDGPAALAARLRPLVHEHSGPFVLTFKLSGGGIVTRVMETPTTELPWFGEVDAERLRLVAMPDGRGVTPYQPILRGELRPEGAGTALALSLAPHPGQQTWSLPFAMVGSALSIWGAWQFINADLTRDWYLGCLAMAFGAAFSLFPTWRARSTFARDCARDLARLRRDLGLPAEPAQRSA